MSIPERAPGMKTGDHVITNARMNTYTKTIGVGRRAVVVRPGQVNKDLFITVRLEGADYVTTVPRFAIEPIGPLDKLADAL